MHKLPLLLVAVLLVLAGCASQKATSAPSLPIFDLQWDYQHPDSTETHFTAILRQAENRHLATYNPSYHAQLLTQIARAQGLQGKFAEAQTSLDAAAKIITDEMPSAHIRYLLEQGRIDNASGKKKKPKHFLWMPGSLDVTKIWNFTPWMLCTCWVLWMFRRNSWNGISKPFK